jgi:copper chaperone CopZ
MVEADLRIEGMTCDHCVMRVKKALGLLPGVTDTQVSVGAAKASYDEMRLRKDDLKRAVEKIGYKVVDGALA